MNPLETRLLTQDDYSQWDHLVEQSECGTIFHTSPWITTSARSHNLKYSMFGAFEGDQLVGGCFFYKKRKRNLFPIGTTRISLSPYGGFLLPNPTKTKVRRYEARRREIVSAILDEIEKETLLSLTITGSPHLIDLRDLLARNWTAELRYTYMIPLDGDIFSNLDGSVRKNIRKAEKHGIVVAKERDPETVWRLLSLTFEKQGLRVPYQRDHLFSLIEDLQDRDQGEVWIARDPSDDPVSSAFIVNNSRYAHGLIAASDPSLLGTGANSLLQFITFQDLQERGFKKFEIWGAKSPRLSAYYSSLNPELVPYYSMRKDRMHSQVAKLMKSLSR